MKTKKMTDQGFTLVELLIVLAISTLVMIGIWNTFSFQQRSYALQRQIVAMEQNLRGGMQLMEMEIRMAGMDPTGFADAKIFDPTTTDKTITPGNSISFTMDLDADSSATGVSNEDITYTTYTDADGIQKLGRRTPSTTGTIQPVAEYITAVDFQFLDGNGNGTTSETAVRSVQITLTARTANDPTRTSQLQTLIHCRNLGI